MKPTNIQRQFFLTTSKTCNTSLKTFNPLPNQSSLQNSFNTPLIRRNTTDILPNQSITPSKHHKISNNNQTLPHHSRSSKTSSIRALYPKNTASTHQHHLNSQHKRYISTTNTNQSSYFNHNNNQQSINNIYTFYQQKYHIHFKSNKLQHKNYRFKANHLKKTRRRNNFYKKSINISSKRHLSNRWVYAEQPDIFGARTSPTGKVDGDFFYDMPVDKAFINDHLTEPFLDNMYKRRFAGNYSQKLIFDKITRQQTLLNSQLRQLENTALRERLYGMSTAEDMTYWDRDLRKFERRQRYLLDKVYKEQIEAVLQEFEEDYAPMIALHLRKEKRAFYWKQLRHKFRFLIYPFSLTWNAIKIAYRIWHRRRDFDTRIKPRFFTEHEIAHVNSTITHIKRANYRTLLVKPFRQATNKFNLAFDSQRELLLQRYSTLRTELYRFRRYSHVNNPKEFISWFYSRSKFDPSQYELRQQITQNLIEGLKGLPTPRPEPKKSDLINNPTAVLSYEDEKKWLLRLFQKYVILTKNTAPSYSQQKWYIRKSREIIDAWYDYYKPTWKIKYARHQEAQFLRKIDKLIQKEVSYQEKLQQQYLKEVHKGRDMNSIRNIYLGIRQMGSVTKYCRHRLKIWFNNRRNATLYDVARKNKRYFGGPSGPPFYKVFLQTRHLLRSPFAHRQIDKLTIGQHDAKSFIRKWQEMETTVRRYPKMRRLMLSAFHDNMMLRSTIYFRLSRYIRRKTPQIEEVRYKYFQEVERVFKAIFLKKERYSFKELYAMSLHEWWYPTSNSIRKFDQFDKRFYDRHDDVDTSGLFSISSIFLTFILFSLTYAYSMGLKDFFQNQRDEREKYYYSVEGADIGHFANQILYADRRNYIFQELKYHGLMNLHDQLSSRVGRMYDAYYSVLDDSLRERYDLYEPANTIVYKRPILASIANTMKGKARDFTIADEYIVEKVQRMWADAACVYASSFDVTLNPYQYNQDERTQQVDIGHFLMAHIDKIAQSATFPEFEGLPQVSYVLDNGLIRIRPQTGDNITVERVMSQDQEERLNKYGPVAPELKGDVESSSPEIAPLSEAYLTLSEAITYLDHTDDCAIAKLSRLEVNFTMMVQLLDAIKSIAKDMDRQFDLEMRVLEIPSSEEINEMQEKGVFEEWLRDWYKKQQSFLPHAQIPQDFAQLKAKQIFSETGNKTASMMWLHYYNRYVRPGKYAPFEDEFGTNYQNFGSIIESQFQGDESYEEYSNDLMLHRLMKAETREEQVLRVFRPHINLLVQNINRLVQLRPRIYRQVKNEMMRKFPGTVDLASDDYYNPDFVEGDTQQMWLALNQHSKLDNWFWDGTVGELVDNYQVPMLLAEELRLRNHYFKNLASGTDSTKLSHLSPKPSEISHLQSRSEVQNVDHELKYQQREKRLTLGFRRAIEYHDEAYDMVFTPDNWDTIYEPMIYGWNLDDLRKRTQDYLKWFHGGLPDQISLEPTPTALEWMYDTTSALDSNSYYDAWTDIYRLIARKKNKIIRDKKPEGLGIPYSNIWIQEKQFQPSELSYSLGELAKRVGDGYRQHYSLYQMRHYLLDHEFWYNRRLFYSRIDRYLKYFKFHLNREWSKDILLTNQRWKKFTNWLTGDQPGPSFYEDYFLSHGFQHFMTSNPIYARYGNDFFFRFFIDAPRFDRRPIALYDRHRYDKDGEDEYFDALYNTRALNNPWPLFVEHSMWSLKPWHEFVNAQFAVYRYLILTDGVRPLDFPQMKLDDLDEIEKFVVPDQQIGYDAVHSWGKDLIDTTYKKQKGIDWMGNYKKDPAAGFKNYLSFHEDYLP